MTNPTPDSKNRLLERIHEKKRDIKAYLKKFEPRGNRLMLLSIVGTGLAALLTAGPAAGGTSFTAALTKAMGTTSPSWRILCAGATILSFIATTALSLHKMGDLTNKVSKAQSALAQLEALETFMDTTELPITNATEQYAQIIRDVPYMPA
ncbi:MAG: hypothetical protein ABI852_18200 [Gemmatimonadaceae bacterium]